MSPDPGLEFLWTKVFRPYEFSRNRTFDSSIRCHANDDAGTGEVCLIPETVTFIVKIP